MRLCVPRERNIVCITVPWTLQTAQAHSRPLNNHFLKKENSEEKNKEERKKKQEAVNQEREGSQDQRQMAQ